MIDYNNLVLIEKKVLGLLFNDEKNLFIEELQERDFSEPQHKKILSLLKKYNFIRGDMFLLKQTLEENREEPIGLYLLDCNAELEFSEQAENYVSLLLQRSKKQQIAEIVYNEKDDLSLDQIKKINTLTRDLLNTEKIEVKFLSEIVADNAIEKLIEKRRLDPPLIPSGFDKFDKHVGIVKKEVTVIGARTNIGKTAYMTQMASFMAETGTKVLYLSCEMTVENMVDRILALQAKIDSRLIRVGRINEVELLRLKNITTDGQSVIFNDPVFALTYVPRLTVAKIQQLIEKYEPEVVFVDHLQAMDTKGEETIAASIGEAMKQIKIIAGENDIGVIVGSQMGREAEKAIKTTDRLTSIYLKGSGGIEEFSDNVYKLELGSEFGKLAVVRTMKGTITKNRFGGYFEIDLEYTSPTLTFREIQ